MTPEKNKEKDMKKILLSFLAVFLIWTLVISCDSNAKTISDETATVSFATSMGKSLTSSVSYTGFEELDWYYQAIPTEGAKFTHGAVQGEGNWKKLSDGLSTFIDLSQGFWTFNLQAKNGDVLVYEGNKANVLIKKQINPIRVEINVSPVAEGKGSIVLSGITIKGIDNTETDPVSYNANKAVITNKDDSSEVFNLNLGTSSETQPVSAGNYSVTVSFEENGIVYGIETLDITVYSGSTVTISGYISEDSQSITFVPSLQDAPVTTFAKQLKVDNISDDKTTAIVSQEEVIENEFLKVTYPENTPITNANADTSSKTADAKTGFVYRGNTLSPTSAGSVSVSSSESVAQYELTLNVSQENSSVYVKVEKVIEKNLVITKVLHSGKELTKTSNAPESVVTDTEYYSYDERDGKLTLYVFHASPIDVITVNRSRLPENAVIVTDVPSLKDALVKGYTYIALGSNIDLEGTGGSEQVIALTDTTIDLNGYTLKGNVESGSYLSSADGTRLTLVDSGSKANDKENGGKIYSKYRLESGAMMQASAVTSWQHAVTINSGVYLSNHVAVVCQVQNTNAAEGVIINDGYFGGTTELIDGYNLPGPVGGCVSAVIGTVTINGGTFKAAQYGPVITADSGSSHVDTIVNINGGTFEGACMFDFYEGSSKVIVNVYGGDFTVMNPNGTTTGITDTSFACNNVDGGAVALVNKEKLALNIMGGTFNYDPSAYVDTNKYNVTENGSTWTVTAK